MIWALLAFLGVPLWLCAAGITVVVFNNHRLRTRPGNLAVRVKKPDKERWTRGHGIWVSDVFAWRGSPAAWDEALVQVEAATLRQPDSAERRKLRRLGEGAVIATLKPVDGEAVTITTSEDNGQALLGPFGRAHDASPSGPH